jgi:tRNA (cmo5U34)-methyltransferase
MSALTEQFNSIAKQYDEQRKYLIPCLNDFYKSCLPIIDRLPANSKVLDLGAGTGLFSQYIYLHQNDFQFTLTDISMDMLSVAKQRFAGLDNFEFDTYDFTAGPISQKYDLIISALAIHHLEDREKETLYQYAYDALNKGGIFINADQVQGRSPWFDDFYKLNWKATVTQSGLEQDAIDRAFERIKLDKFGKLETQLLMLEQAGFSETDCIYKSNNFAVLAGLK